MSAIVPLYPYKAWVPAPIYWLYRAWRTLAVAFCFAGFWSGSVLVVWLWFPILSLWPGTRVAKMRRSLRMVGRGFRLFHFVMFVLRLYDKRSSTPVLRPPGVSADVPVIVVANHPTLCDVTSIVSLFPNVVAVAGAGYGNNALLQRGLRRCGFVPTGIHVMKECEERLRMGFDVLVFPEGTRSPVGGLQPFHRGAFELAARAKVPIVLVKLTCAPSALSKRLPIWKHPDQAAMLTIEPFDVIYPEPSALDSRAMSRTIEQRYRQLLGYPATAEATGEPQPLGAVQ